MQHIRNLSIDQLEKTLLDMNESTFRLKQILQWLYSKRINNLSEMTNLSKKFRERFAKIYTAEKMIPEVCLESEGQDAVKFAFRTDDGHIIESVILINGIRRTLCVSSQIGCKLGCVFCATSKLGFIRNLSLSEILGQVIAANDYLVGKDDKLITNIVFMGMGEALDNLDALLPALDIIKDGRCFGIGGRKITISTAGVIPDIRKFMDARQNVGLAISLNSWSNESRNAIMPINKTYPIESLIDIAAEYFRVIGQRVTFEYVVISGENDTIEAAEALVNYCSRIPCKVNLIPLNTHKYYQKEVPDANTMDKLGAYLANHGVTVMIRRSRGHDIGGACGQLAGEIV